ncbi:hypothetical protein NMY22_g14971 [Coprinellus aureogranulatus]|nr:hypothetical protein NMY22_g14971 [Coprinellus aureogranulatus]
MDIQPLQQPGVFPGVIALPDHLVIAESDVQIDWSSVICIDAIHNVYQGLYRGQPARFTEKRPLRCYTEAGINIYSMLVSQALLRAEHQTPRHLPLAGIFQSSAALGNRFFLVEAPYHHIPLAEYLATHPHADRRLLCIAVLEILVDLHSAGMVLGRMTTKSFVVDAAGRLYLSNFEFIRLNNPNEAFSPVPSPSVGGMAYLAPELMESLRVNGNAALTRASDVYSAGCLVYELFTGASPFSEQYRGYPTQMAQFKLITSLVDQGCRLQRPEVGSDAYSLFGLTDRIWNIIEECTARNPASRPSASAVLDHLA